LVRNRSTGRQAQAGLFLAVSSLPTQSRDCRYGTRPAREFKLKNAAVLCTIAVVAAFAGNAEAIYKCTTSKGVVYQDRPCREGTESDVQIVIPTGELAPKPAATQDDPVQGNVIRPENAFGAPKQSRTGNEPASAAKPADNRAGTQATSPAADDARKPDTRAAADSAAPMTADQARKTDATAKYYTTDAAAPGPETPEQMTCESPTGQKRIFFLANGKLTSI
jgi:hypothetical protein